MVKINQQYLIRHSDRLLPPRLKNESDVEFLNRVTHLKLQGRYIHTIEKLSNCKNVAYLYLQNNLLQNIENLDNFTKLTHLYLQRNKISKLDNLHSLINLKKLYLGYNEISVIENLENCKLLKEVHVENQFLPMGESLYFDPRCLESLSSSLELINISNNGLFMLGPISILKHLKELNASDNKLADDDDLLSTLQNLPELQTLKIQGNPICRQRTVKDLVIMNGRSLKYVDNIEITEKTRAFVEGWLKSTVRGRERVKKTTGDDLFAAEKPMFAQVRQHLPMPETAHIYKYQPWKLRKNIQIKREFKPANKKKPEHSERIQSQVTFN